MSQELEYLPPDDDYRELSPMSDISDRTERPHTYTPSSPLTPPPTPRSSRHIELTDDEDTISSSTTSPFPSTPRTPHQHTSGRQQLPLKPLTTPSSSRRAVSGSLYAEYFKILASGDRSQYRRAQEMGYGLFPGSTPPNTPSRVTLAMARPLSVAPLVLRGGVREEGVLDGTMLEQMSLTSEEGSGEVDADSDKSLHSTGAHDSGYRTDSVVWPEEESTDERIEDVADRDSAEYDPVLHIAIRESLTARPSMRATDRDSSWDPSSHYDSDGKQRADHAQDTQDTVDAGQAEHWQGEAMVEGHSLGESAFARPRRTKARKD